jgi:hypothetical protein
VLYKITNLGIHTPPAICSYQPSPSEISLLSKGLNFVPSAPPIVPDELQHYVQEFLDNLYQENSLTAEFRRIQSSLRNLSLASTRIPVAKNLTDDESKALLTLRSNPTIRILPADKNLGTVICDTKWYLSECYRQLNDSKTYTRSKQTLQSLQQDVSTYVSFLDLSRAEQQRMLSGLDLTTFPKFYILPKVHKTPILGRPIVGAHSAPTTGISKWVDSQLKRLLPVIPTYVKGSLEVAQRIQDFVIQPRKPCKDPAINALPNGLCLFAADVSSLYPSIPQRKGVAAVREFLRTEAQGSLNPKMRIEEKRVSMVVLCWNLFSPTTTSPLKEKSFISASEPLWVLTSHLALQPSTYTCTRMVSSSSIVPYSL